MLSQGDDSIARIGPGPIAKAIALTFHASTHRDVRAGSQMVAAM